MEKYGFVYIWYDRKHKRYYIGCRWGHVDDGYICSSRWMRKAYHRRPEDFKRRILTYVYTNRQDLLEAEYKWLSMISDHELKIRYYNLRTHQWGHWSADTEKTKTIKEKMSAAIKKAHACPKVREKYLNSLKTRDNKSSDPEVREKRRASMLATMEKKFPKENRKQCLSKDDPELIEIYRKKSIEMWSNRTDEEKQEIGEKISKTNKGLKNRLGHTNSPEHRKKISESLKGKKLSEEHLENIKKAALARRGQKQSEEHRKNRSEAVRKWWGERKALK